MARVDRIVHIKRKPLDISPKVIAASIVALLVDALLDPVFHVSLSAPVESVLIGVVTLAVAYAVRDRATNPASLIATARRKPGEGLGVGRY